LQCLCKRGSALKTVLFCDVASGDRAKGLAVIKIFCFPYFIALLINRGYVVWQAHNCCAVCGIRVCGCEFIGAGIRESAVVFAQYLSELNVLSKISGGFVVSITFGLVLM